ncbi:hypothetical protein [Rhizobium leguminosarum]|uniref:hypothetical protein n=1 Tax=Rhizobium leguminosarum TaxID=384 RepID=UPI001FE09588|nr:hypothetical protein [Rhizobium leguminosarum]
MLGQIKVFHPAKPNEAGLLDERDAEFMTKAPEDMLDLSLRIENVAQSGEDDETRRSVEAGDPQHRSFLAKRGKSAIVDGHSFEWYGLGEQFSTFHHLAQETVAGSPGKLCCRDRCRIPCNISRKQAVQFWARLRLRHYEMMRRL